ncbi:MAG: hypothetical protein QM767_05370 [Anaeromyxobacter sp.]
MPRLLAHRRAGAGAAARGTVGGAADAPERVPCRVRGRLVWEGGEAGLDVDANLTAQLTLPGDRQVLVACEGPCAAAVARAR